MCPANFQKGLRNCAEVNRGGRQRCAPGDPVLQDAGLVAEGNAQDARMVSAADVLHALVAGGTLCIRDESGPHRT